MRLRMICQSWKVMFQAEYSSGQPLRMLVDLRASVEAALGSDSADESGEKALERTAAAKASGTPGKPHAAAAAAGVGGALKAPAASPRKTTQSASDSGSANHDAPEFEISAAPEWNADEEPQPKKKR